MEKENIMNEMTAVSIEFARRANDLFEEVLKMKLEMAESRAFLDGNYVLADILYGYRIGEIRNLVDTLKSKGYEMQIMQPENMGATLENMHMVFKIDPKDVRVRIYQIVLEI